ncbi:glutamine--fructose-6-phosphate transaminase (isomerizing) [Candidatus Saccharibacteria bacterium]|nr:glutamine--fructose-6-phosphate transaminase (isomerizing) [Candidatus Saccharibacteria bacterium]
MCGIMGYIGHRPAKQIIKNGLQQLEYRGYDSAGIAVNNQKVHTTKCVGDTSNLNIDSLPDTATIGIGHTRWATHGKPTTSNAHPHTYGKITLVHNGIIENYEDLKAKFAISNLKSQTDSEVLAAVIDNFYKQTKDLLTAVKQAMNIANGTFGLAIMSVAEPDNIIVARRGSPIVIGVDENQYYIASDASAIIDHTDKVIYLEDDQIAQINRESLSLYDLKLTAKQTAIQQLSADDYQNNLGQFGSYLEKEIHEQPKSLHNVMRGRVSLETIQLGGPRLDANNIKSIKQILIIGCGTAYYAGYYAKYELEKILGISVSVEYASEFRYRYGAYDPDSTLAIFMSQSGETADTLASLQEAKRRGIKTMGIINTVGSTIAREVTHGGIYLHAGMEASVASTKAYSSMVAALLMLGGHMSYKSGADSSITRRIASELKSLPTEIAHTLNLQPQIKKIASKLAKKNNWFFLGRDSLYPVALEGALKLTEVTYIHAQGLPSGEMKHGPIALIDKQHVSVVLMPEDELLYSKSLSTLEEIKARSGIILTVGTRPKESISDYHIEVAHNGEYTDGLIYNTVLQLLTLSIAEYKGRNIDRPRNLAKSVTVE